MINSVRLQNFRSYKDESFEFEAGVNIVVGPNASGKTNLLEAVLVLARGNSYRAKDQELIEVGKPWARLDGNFTDQNRVIKLEKHNNFLTKTYLLDEKPYKRLNLDKTVPLVYFEPNHLQLITRGPEQRRDYFDELLERSTPGYKTLLASYKRTLAQRNSLLKQGPSVAGKQLFAWNIRLSELGEKVALARQDITADINQELSRTYQKTSKQKTELSMQYLIQFPAEYYANFMLRKLEANINDDFLKGFTSYGPHREDYNFILNKQNASVSASRGENRSIMLSLKIFELKLIEKVRGAKAIFLLDDVFSELDGARRRALVGYLNDRQTIITTTDADTVIDYFDKGHNIIALSP